MEKAAAEPLGRDLAHALRTGPFSAALHLAIESRGMRLEEIQERLSAGGISVSVTTLSYWRRGRSRPERPDSLRAVRLIEEILGLPAESLMAQLGPRRPRGRWLSHPPGSIELDRLFEDPASISKMMADLYDRFTFELSRISMHDLYRIGPQGQEISLTVRQVLRANVDKVGKTVTVFQTDDPGIELQLLPRRNCRIGRLRADPVSGLIAAEVVFDRVLSVGETAVIEYEFLSSSQVPTDRYFRGFAVPSGDYVLEVQFDPAAVPARCYRFERRAISAPDQGVREVWIGSTHCAHVVASDVPAGMVGLRWEWE